jgi:hypothetical protein
MPFVKTRDVSKQARLFYVTLKSLNLIRYYVGGWGFVSIFFYEGLNGRNKVFFGRGTNLIFYHKP